MTQTIATLSSREKILLFGLIWVLLFLLPWGNLLSFEGNLYLLFIGDMVKLGVALVVFIVPGVLLYLLFRYENDLLAEPLGILPIGFTFSVMLIAVIGVMGRILGFSFVLVKALFALVGLGELILLSSRKPDFAIRKKHFSRLFQTLFKNVPLMLALLLAVSAAFNEQQFFLDDTTYAAYVRNWQYSSRLGFNNIIHQANVLEHARFWLALYPMGQALLADLSGVPVILLFSSYLELYLVPLAVIAAYWFACILGFSRRVAGLSVLIQISLYILMLYNYWPVGFWFLMCMIEDKVSAVFLLAPVFFVFVLKFLESPTRNNILQVLLSGIALTVTHPVILFYACSIAAALMGFSWYVKKTDWREMRRLVTVLLLLMLPYLTIRLYGHSSQSMIPFDAQAASMSFHVDRFINVVNGFFYGISPQVLMLLDISPESKFHAVFQGFRLLPVFLATTAGALAIVRIKAGALYWYVLSCVLLVTFAAIPYTGWILGYFVSARMISRASWFSPLGLAGTLVLMFISERLTSNRAIRESTAAYAEKVRRESRAYARMLNYSALAIGLAIVLALPRVAPYFRVLNHNEQLARVGAYMDRNTSAPTMVMALDYGDIQLLPAVAAHSSLISFREETDRNGHNYFLSLDEVHERIYASNIIKSLDSSTSPEERCRLLKKFNVRFILGRPDRAHFFTAEVNKCGILTTEVFDTKDLVLLEFQNDGNSK